MTTDRYCKGNCASSRRHTTRKTTTPWWQQPATTIPILISALAVAIAGLAYFNQRVATAEATDATTQTINTYKTAEAANQMQYATLVNSYPSGPNEKYDIQNLSKGNLSLVMLNATVTFNYSSINLNLYIGDLPACTGVTANLADPEILQRAVQDTQAGSQPTPADWNSWVANANFVVFTDPDGLNWIENGYGAPKQIALPHFTNTAYLQYSGALTTTTNVPGCS
jgi:hypothetical protein